MSKNAQNLDVTTDSLQTIGAIDQFIDQSLCDGKDAEVVILKAIGADPKGRYSEVNLQVLHDMNRSSNRFTARSNRREPRLAPSVDSNPSHV